MIRALADRCLMEETGAELLNEQTSRSCRKLAHLLDSFRGRELSALDAIEYGAVVVERWRSWEQICLCNIITVVLAQFAGIDELYRPKKGKR